jgi:hypothetical protein
MSYLCSAWIIVGTVSVQTRVTERQQVPVTGTGVALTSHSVIFDSEFRGSTATIGVLPWLVNN